MFIGRLDPMKGVENLLKAVALLRSEDISLHIYGSGDSDYASDLARLARDLDLEGRVTFGGFVEGAAKRDAFLQADVCVVPSYSENFGMVVVEALAHGTPVIASTGTPWKALESHKAGKWTANDPEALATAIESLRREDLAAMGRRGREWVGADFGWQVVGEQMLKAYQAVISRAAERTP